MRVALSMRDCSSTSGKGLDAEGMVISSVYSYLRNDVTASLPLEAHTGIDTSVKGEIMRQRVCHIHCRSGPRDAAHVHRARGVQTQGAQVEEVQEACPLQLALSVRGGLQRVELSPLSSLSVHERPARPLGWQSSRAGVGGRKCSRPRLCATGSVRRHSRESADSSRGYTSSAREAHVG